MVLVKNLKFFLLFVFGDITPENVFGDDVNSKIASKNYKNIGLRKSQNLRFPKGTWFWPKI